MMEMKLYGSHMEMEKKLSDIKKLAQMDTKLYGSHMEMEENLSDIKNISFDGNGSVWKLYGNGRKPF